MHSRGKQRTAARGVTNESEKGAEIHGILCMAVMKEGNGLINARRAVIMHLTVLPPGMLSTVNHLGNIFGQQLHAEAK